MCRLNWAAFGVGKPVDGETNVAWQHPRITCRYEHMNESLTAHELAGVDFSCFVGDLAPDITDYVLQEHFRAQYPSVRSAKVCVLFLASVPCSSCSSPRACKYIVKSSF